MSLWVSFYLTCSSLFKHFHVGYMYIISTWAHWLVLHLVFPCLSYRNSAVFDVWISDSLQWHMIHSCCVFWRQREDKMIAPSSGYRCVLQAIPSIKMPHTKVMRETEARHLQHITAFNIQWWKVTSYIYSSTALRLNFIVLELYFSTTLYFATCHRDIFNVALHLFDSYSYLLLCRFYV